MPHSISGNSYFSHTNFLTRLKNIIAKFGNLQKYGHLPIFCSLIKLSFRGTFHLMFAPSGLLLRCQPLNLLLFSSFFVISALTGAPFYFLAKPSLFWHYLVNKKFSSWRILFYVGSFSDSFTVNFGKKIFPIHSGFSESVPTSNLSGRCKWSVKP